MDPARRPASATATLIASEHAAASHGRGRVAHEPSTPSASHTSSEADDGSGAGRTTRRSWLELACEHPWSHRLHVTHRLP